MWPGAGDSGSVTCITIASSEILGGHRDGSGNCGCGEAHRRLALHAEGRALKARARKSNVVRDISRSELVGVAVGTISFRRYD